LNSFELIEFQFLSIEFFLKEVLGKRFALSSKVTDPVQRRWEGKREANENKN
jgi:hypothetical protein